MERYRSSPRPPAGRGPPMPLGNLPLRELPTGPERVAVEQHDFAHETNEDPAGLDATSHGSAPPSARPRRRPRRPAAARASRPGRSAPRCAARDRGHPARDRRPGLPMNAGRREAPRRAGGDRARADRRDDQRADRGPHPRGAAFRRDRRDGRMISGERKAWVSRV